MKRKVTRNEYIGFFKENPELRPVSTFSDPTGTSPYGIGRPSMDTDWGYDNQVLATCEMRKETESDEWENTYYLSVQDGLKLSNFWGQLSKFIRTYSGAGLEPYTIGKLSMFILKAQEYFSDETKNDLCYEIAWIFVNDGKFRGIFKGYDAGFADELASALSGMSPIDRANAISSKLSGQDYNGLIW